MVASDGPGEYVVAFAAHAGAQQQRLESGSVAYITTGAQLLCTKVCAFSQSEAFAVRQLTHVTTAEVLLPLQQQTSDDASL